MTDMYAPNQQAVREDGSGPAEEGSGGDAGGAPEGDAERSLDDMTKAELLDEAAARGVAVDDSMTKAAIRAALEAEPE